MSPKQDVGIVSGVAVDHAVVTGEDGTSRLGADDDAATQPDAGGDDRQETHGAFERVWVDPAIRLNRQMFEQDSNAVHRGFQDEQL
jgi:hypothetical protein